jgi:hypothetical protein
MQGLFSKHLELLGIPHKMGDLPKLVFDPIDEESPFESTRRVVLAYEAGITTLNEARSELGMIPERGDLGKQRGSKSSNTTKGDLPRENENR